MREDQQSPNPPNRWQELRLWWNRHNYIKYLVVIAIFALFSLVFGEANLVRQVRYSKRISRLESELSRSKERYWQDSLRYEDFRNDKDGIEHTARERFLMKAPNELVFLVADTSSGAKQ